METNYTSHNVNKGRSGRPRDTTTEDDILRVMGSDYIVIVPIQFLTFDE